jgi:methylmalonyl-CoA mutase
VLVSFAFMSEQAKTPGSGFKAPAFSDWTALAEHALKGADLEQALVRRTASGIARGPLRTARDDPANSGVPGAYPFVRGISASVAPHRPWHITQSFSMADPVAANAAILDDLAGGVSALLLYLDPTGKNGIAVHTQKDLQTVLAGVDLCIVPVLLQARPLNAAYAAMLVTLWQDMGLDVCSGGLGFSPVGQTIRHGMDFDLLPEKLNRTAAFARWATDHAPGVATAIITSSLIHEAGGSDALELAFAAAGGISYFKVFREFGLSPDEAARAIMFSLSLDADVPLGIAKLRAARRIWARLMSACNVDEAACAMNIHVGTSKRMMSRLSPYTNVLRTSTAAFAAASGGAQFISVEPYDLAIGTNNTKARRIARNVQIILQEEMHAGRVIDPAGGSYAIEKLTNDLAEAAWAAFQKVERQGGLIKAAQSGWLAKTVTAQREARFADIRSGKVTLVGVTGFMEDGERLPASPPPAPVPAAPNVLNFPEDFTLQGYLEAARAGAKLLPMGSSDPNPAFAPTNFCAPFEDERTGEEN